MIYVSPVLYLSQTSTDQPVGAIPTSSAAGDLSLISGHSNQNHSAITTVFSKYKAAAA